METKEIKINIPEGYEIDKENSTFECIKFKPIKKDNITYQEICDNIFKGNYVYFINSYGNIGDTLLAYIRSPIMTLKNASNKKQIERLLALNQLMNIAYYYNGKRYIRTGHYIEYDKLEDRYFVNNSDNDFTQKAEMTALFINAEDAQAVIDNPNFRSILDTLCK